MTPSGGRRTLSRPSRSSARLPKQGGFTAANLRAEGVEIPAGAKNLLEVRGWITRSPEWTKKKPRAVIWVMTPEAVRFLDAHGLVAPAGGATA